MYLYVLQHSCLYNIFLKESLICERDIWFTGGVLLFWWRSSCKHAQNILISCFFLWSYFSGCYCFTFSTLAARSPPPSCFYSRFILFSLLPSFVFSLLIHAQYIILLTVLLTLLYFISIHQEERAFSEYDCMTHRYGANYFPFNYEYWPGPCWWKARQATIHPPTNFHRPYVPLTLSFLLCLYSVSVSCSLLHLHQISCFP